MEDRLARIEDVLLQVAGTQGELRADVRYTREMLEQRGRRLDDVEREVDKLRTKHAYSTGKNSVVSTIGGLLGGGLMTWFVTHFR